MIIITGVPLYILLSFHSFTIFAFPFFQQTASEDSEGRAKNPPRL